MKLISKALQLFILFILVTATSCKEDLYPDLEDGLYAEIVTSKDTMVAKLFFEKVPVTVANFVALAEGTHPLVSEQFKGKPFYDSLTFHRVMDKFMIQGGDHTATGSGDPGYRFVADFDPSLKHDKAGVLSMANGGGIDTNGSQFFITEVPYPSLDAFDANGDFKPCDQRGVSCHSVFGQLVKGIEVQDSISNVKVGRGNKPLENVYIYKVNIIRKGSAAKSFNAAKVFEEQMPKVKEDLENMKELARIRAEEEKKAREAKNAEAGAEIKIQLDEYLTKATETASGLRVYYINKGDGEKPAQGKRAYVNYEGYYEDGRLFDSNVEAVAERHGMLDERRKEANMYKPFPMKISPDAQLIAGMKEALANMRVGDKVYMYIPYHLAYGERDYGPIPAKSNLSFIAEMTGIE